MKKTGFAYVAIFALSVGCGVEPDQEDGQDTEDLVSPNGVSLNGVSLNGVSLNGVSLNGVSLNGVSLNGVSLNGVNITGVTLASSQLKGTKNNKAIAGDSFEGTSWTGTMSNGQSIKVRIDEVDTGPSPNSDVFMYAISYQTSGGWNKLCGVDTSGNPILAVAMPGTFNYGWGVAGGGSFTSDAANITFGCRGFALAKCVEMGYKYWKPNPANSSQTLLNHTLSCVRMLRADYCGDGQSWTVNGTPIDLYDAVGIQYDAENWPLEAEWGPNGATCVSPTNYLRWQNTSGTAPTCLASKKILTCGLVTHFLNPQTLIMDEYTR